MADFTSTPPLSAFVIAEDNKDHSTVTVTAMDLDLNNDKSATLSTDKQMISKDETIHGLMDQLKTNTDRLAALETLIKSVNSYLGLPEEPVADSVPTGATEDHIPVPDPSDAEAGASDTDEEDPDDNGDPDEDDRKTTAKIIAMRMKHVPSEDWVSGKLANVHCINDISPSSQSVVVSLEPITSAIIHATQPKLAEADSTSVPDNVPSRPPDRLLVPCATLLAEIAKVSGTTISKDTNVFVRPFKNVLPFRKEYQESLNQNREVYNTLKASKKERKVKFAEACKIAEEKDESLPPKEEKRLPIEDQAKLDTAKKLYHGLTCLLHFIDHDNAEIMDFRRQVKNKDFEIAFENLWHLFEPGQIVCPKSDKDQAYRVLNVGGGRPHRTTPDHDGSPPVRPKVQKITDFSVDCFHIDFNGTSYVPTPLTIHIPPYEGTRSIKNLAIRPLEYLYQGDEEKAMTEKLINRGKKFERLAAVSHQRYYGLSLQVKGSRCEEVDGDVIIDFALAFKNNPTNPYMSLSDANIAFQPPGLDIPVTEYYTPQSVEETREDKIQACSIPNCETCRAVITCSYDDADFELVRRSRFLDNNAALLKQVEKELGDDRHLLLPYRMYGYVLLSRKWYPLDIDLLEDIDEGHTESDGFSDLVLPDEHKDIVRALVKTHARGPRSASGENGRPVRQLDLVKGKGKGLIILLHGVPGVGKTSTAECVAAHTNRPLFPITCGDIGGQTPREVETNLESYFDLARKWGCVLLLDEADVFLGERTKGDILQNSLISVFLRVLEYYSGILILTTNRVGQFDEAITSRIHISLYYPPLDEERTLEIWRMNLERLEREHGANSGQSRSRNPRSKATLSHVEFDAKKIMDFARGHFGACKLNNSQWNGRQIKNAFQTAIALAEWDVMEFQRTHKVEGQLHVVLQRQHFKKVADASAKFDEYLVGVRKTDSYNAKANGNRLDEFIDQGTSSVYGTTYATYNERKQQHRNTKRGRMQAGMRDEDSQDDDFRMKKQNDTVETRRYQPDERARKEPAHLDEVSDRGNRRNGQYALAQRLHSGRETEYDDGYS